MSAGEAIGELARAAAERAPQWIVAGLAAEAGPVGEFDGRARVRRVEEPRLEASVARFLEDSGPQATGAGLEPKLRVVSFVRARDGAVEVELSPTTWELGRGFHMALLAQERAPEAAKDWLAAAFRGRPVTPGLAAVHGAVTTTDGKLALMRRSAEVLYRPSHWAATFEEQMVQADLAESDALAFATLRGVHEELGVPRELCRTRFLCALIELETLNLAFYSHIAVEVSSTELVRLARTAPDACDADRLVFVDALPAVLRELSRSGGGSAHAPLHPTSALRLEVLARYLEPARP